MPAIRTNRNFTKEPNAQLSEFLGGTITGFTDNNQLPNPPVAIAQLTTLKEDFDKAIIAAKQGGSAATAARNDQRLAVIDALERNASYVDLTVGGNLEAILAAGYKAVSSNRARVVLDPPNIIAVDYGQAGELKLRVSGDTNRRAIQGRIKKATDGDFGPTITFRNSKAIVFNALIAGTTYVMQLCGIGGSTGQSDWSEPVSKMAL